MERGSVRKTAAARLTQCRRLTRALEISALEMYARTAATGRPMSNALFDSLTSARPADSEHPFACFPGRAELSYADFYAAARRAAGGLIGNGVSPGDRVAVQADKSITILSAYLGTVAAGGVFLPLNSAYTDAEVRYFLNDARPKVFICDPGRKESLGTLARSAGAQRVFTLDQDGGGSLKDLIDRSVQAQAIARNGPDLAAILYTSGTTGKPKGAMLSHSALVSNARALTEIWRFGPQDRLIHTLPLHHTHGLFVASNIALMAGCSLIFLQRFDVDAIVDALRGATAMMAIPTHYVRLLRSRRLSRKTAPRMRLFVSGSAPLAASTHREWTRRTGHEILERYGMTEANMICSIPYEGPRKPGAVGRPLPGIELRIRVLDSGRIGQQGEAGMLEIRSPGLFTGYWNMPDRTRQEFTDDGYFVTGDLARVDSDGFAVIEGRAKDLVISGGVNIHPKEIEDVINQTAGAEECAVVGVPHPDFGEGVIAVVVPHAGAALSPEAVRHGLDGRLARYKHPKHIEIRASLPRNTMGKVQKAALREEFSDLFAK